MNIFKNSGKFWNWLVVSSSDPTSVALTVKGWVSSAVPLVMIVIHNPNLSNVPNEVYAAIVGTFGVISAGVTAYGLIRKIISSFTSSTPATPIPPASSV